LAQKRVAVDKLLAEYRDKLKNGEIALNKSPGRKVDANGNPISNKKPPGGNSSSNGGSSGGSCGNFKGGC
jgi:hypothetical protein